MRFTPFVFVLGLALAAPAGRAFAQDATTDRLIGELGADDVGKRDDAQKKLESLGKKALPALEKAEKESPDAEIRARAHEAILAIRKGKGDPSDAKPEKDQEREGPPLPPERRFGPRPPRAPQQNGEDEEQGPGMDDFMKLFGGDSNDPMMKQLPKIFEHLQRQMRGLDEEFNKELRRPNGQRGNMRVFTFNARSKTPTEERLGIAVDPTPPALQAQLDLSPTDGGVLVNELDANGPAWKAGLKLYDVVLSIDGKAVRSPDDLASLGTKDAKVEILRKAKKETLLVHAQDAADKPAPETKPEPKPEKRDEPQIRKF